ncbi:MAG: hypothetical protein U0176_14825 [Bacteroidia bacterium]
MMRSRRFRGLKKIHRLEENLGALKVNLTATDLEEIEAAVLQRDGGRAMILRFG